MNQKQHVAIVASSKRQVSKNKGPNKQTSIPSRQAKQAAHEQQRRKIHNASTPTPTTKRN